MKFKYQNCCGPVVHTRVIFDMKGKARYTDYEIFSVKIPKEPWRPKIMRRFIQFVRRKVGF